MIRRLWTMLTGYLVIQVRGLSLEKFINLCISNGIYLWGMKRPSYTVIQCNIKINDFRKLRKIDRSIHCKIYIIDKKGLPFLSSRLKKRKLLIIGLFLCICILYYLNSFVWLIEVKGSKNINKTQILSDLNKIGIRNGINKTDIDSAKIENQMIIKDPQISWIGIEVKGVKMIVRVVESVKTPEIVDYTAPCNIISTKDGIISRTIVYEGIQTVKTGETVRKGQLLVSGIIQHEEGTVRYVHSRADIYARIWYQGDAEIKLSGVKKVRTGRKCTLKYIQLFDKKIYIKKGNIDYKNYEKETIDQYLGGSNFLIPVKVTEENYYEINIQNITKDVEKLKPKAEDTAYSNAKKLITANSKIVDKQVKFSMIKGDTLKATVYLETIEPIGVQVPFQMNKEDQNIGQPKTGDKN